MNDVDVFIDKHTKKAAKIVTQPFKTNYALNMKDYLSCTRKKILLNKLDTLISMSLHLKSLTNI